MTDFEATIQEAIKEDRKNKVTKNQTITMLKRVGFNIVVEYLRGEILYSYDDFKRNILYLDKCCKKLGDGKK